MQCSELENQGYIATLQSIEYKNFTPRDFGQIDGAILCYIENEKTLQSLQENFPKDFPIINIHGSKPISNVTTILMDVKKGAYQATSYLIEAGCSHLAYIGAHEDSTISKLKLGGFQESIQGYLKSTEYSLVQNYSFTMQSGYNAAAELYNKNPSIDGVFCENDLFAAGVVHYFIDHKKRIPEDIRIIGYDDIPLATMFIPSISSVSIPTADICSSACAELSSLLNKKGSEDRYFLPKLVHRQTTLLK